MSKITEDMKIAMKSKDSLALNTIRMLRAEIKNAEIAKMDKLTEDEIVKVVQTAIKKRKEAAEQYKNAGREDLYKKEMAEAKVLEKYLPEQLEEDELKKIIADVINETKSDNFGIIMKTVMSKVGSKAEGKVVNKLVKEMLSGNN
jgi:uncharacterized protein YqeY